MFENQKITFLRDHQIEQLLLHAHLQEDLKTDLIEEYFSKEFSLDPITNRAQQLIKEHNNPVIQSAILKNLSECIVVKMQKEKYSFWGFVKKILSKMGIHLGKSVEIRRAEQLIKIHKVTLIKKDFSKV